MLSDSAEFAPGHAEPGILDASLGGTHSLEPSIRHAVSPPTFGNKAVPFPSRTLKVLARVAENSRNPLDPVVRRTTEASPRRARPSTQAFAMKTILLADDESNLRTLVRTTLEDPELRILEAATGTEALETARRERPDLLLLDWMMPGLTGIEVMKALRLDPATAGIPIVMLTAKGQDRDRVEALALGAQAYLVKPFSPLQLLSQVREVLESASAAGAAAGAGSEGTPRPPDPSDSQAAIYARDLRRVLESERKKAAELADANERLNTLNILKSDFLSFISHELRTPLHALSAVHMLDAQGDPSEQAELADITRHGYERLQSIVERGLRYFNWLAIEKVATTATTDLLALAEGVAGRVPGLGDPGVDFRIQHAPGRFLVRGEEEDLGDVVRILLENALRSSPREKVVQVRLDTVGDRHVLSVADRGAGLSRETARDLFQPYTIANIAHHGAETGLDLATAGAIVRTHGGRIRAESPGLGQGSVFSVELPIVPAGTAEVRASLRAGDAA